MTDDTEEEIPKEVEDMYDKMIDMFEGNQTDHVMHALNSAITTVICNAALSKENALFNVMLLATNLASTIEEADKAGDCAWSQRRH
jgi:Tfp pilus assembly pilus retraction ATPase PilT